MSVEEFFQKKYGITTFQAGYGRYTIVDLLEFARDYNSRSQNSLENISGANERLTKDTIEGLVFSGLRHVGNSTKQIDYAIAMLFKGYKVQVRDHINQGLDREANKHLFNRIMERLQIEHQITPVYDLKKLTIQLN
jgi:hypothetical protein